MESIRRRPRTPAQTTHAPAPVKAARSLAVDKEDTFESLRQAFHARLESERVHFVTLSAALARAEENPAWIFDDLVYRAHRLQGGAAIFEEAAVAVAAGKLESAAVMASQIRADNTNQEVWTALEALVTLMGSVEPVRGAARV
jgi:HPt (histidine-containing phosphotransfer) domain-containing protein